MRWEFRLPDLGEGIHEAEVVSWLVQPGDEVSEDQIVAEIETDKAIAEIPSPVNGEVVELLAAEGAVVQVGQPLLVFEVEAAPAVFSGRPGPGVGEEAEDEPGGEARGAGQPQANDQLRVKGQPRVEAPSRAAEQPRAEEQTRAGDQSGGEDLTRARAEAQVLVGAQPQVADRTQAEDEPLVEVPVETRPQVNDQPRAEDEPRVEDQARTEGRPQAEDQLRAAPYVRRLARDLGIDITTLAGTGPAGRVTQPDVLRAANEAGRSPERVPLRGIRRATALNMARSFYTAPHAAVMDEVEVGELVRLREILLPRAETRQVKLTYLPFIIMATVRALKKHPYMNASLDDERQEIILRYEYNIGIATDTPGGLLVPVIKAADTLDLWGLAAEIERLAEAARRQQLEHREMQNGTFTITNVGPLGGVWSVPIIRHPEVAILAVHRIQKRPVVRGERVEVGQMLNLVLTFDHRVVDGADALRFLKDLRLYLEHPALIFMPEV